MIGAGCLFYSQRTNRFLFILRNRTNTKGTWGMVGGKILDNESIHDGLFREIAEEIGSIPVILKQIPLETYTSSNDNFTYHSYIFVVEDEFLPCLNEESGGFCWSPLDSYPKPVHPGIWNVINVEAILNKIKYVQKSNYFVSKKATLTPSA